MANYNNAKYIATAIESVINQNYTHWELIIVDDSSTDNSIGKINSYLKDKRIKSIQNKENRGYGATLRTAANVANNLVIGILDPDDKLHDTALEVMAEAYRKNPKFGFLYSTMWICDSNLRNCKIDSGIGPIFPEKTNIFKNRVSHFKTFLRQEYFKTSGFDVNQKKSVDKDIIYKLEEVTNFKFINMPLYYYRHHESGISQGKQRFEARVYHYIAKCKTYKRRYNNILPNYTRRDLYIEYIKITFHGLLNLLKNIFYKSKINHLIVSINKRFPFVHIIFKKKLYSLIDFFLSNYFF